MSIWDNVHQELSGELHHGIERIRQWPGVVALESEIERAFAVTFIMGMRVSGINRHLIFGEPTASSPPDEWAFFLHPQVQIDQYRVDFVFGGTDDLRAKACIAIECDGHEWHEKTKEQAARDKARDRHLSKLFGSVIHFTGSEIYRRPGQCWAETGDVLAQLRMQK